MYFLRGSLPWQGLRANTKKQKYEKIMEKKMTTPIEQLCKSFPQEFTTYFEYCRSLRFEDKPDYKYLKRLFKELFFTEGYQLDCQVGRLLFLSSPLSFFFSLFSFSFSSPPPLYLYFQFSISTIFSFAVPHFSPSTYRPPPPASSVSTTSAYLHLC